VLVINSFRIAVIIAAVLTLCHGWAVGSDDRSSTGGFLTFGYGKLGIGYPPNYYGVNGLSNPPAMDDKWGMILLGGGYFLAGGRTQLEVDLYATRAKHLKSYSYEGFGGTIYVDRTVRNWCILVRIRQQIVNRLYVSGGIGMLEETTENNSNAIGGGNAWSRDYGAYSLGVSARVWQSILVGIQHLWVSRTALFGEYQDEIHPSRDATLLELTWLIVL
jgi:hypothetical protein